MKSLSRNVARTEASQTLPLSALAKKLRAEGVEVVTLTAGEPDFPTPFHVKEAAKKAIEDNLTRYTQNAGIPQLRKAIAEKWRIGFLGARQDIVAAAEKVQGQVTSNASSISRYAPLSYWTRNGLW